MGKENLNGIILRSHGNCQMVPVYGLRILIRMVIWIYLLEEEAFPAHIRYLLKAMFWRIRMAYLMTLPRSIFLICKTWE